MSKKSILGIFFYICYAVTVNKDSEFYHFFKVNHLEDRFVYYFVEGLDNYIAFIWIMPSMLFLPCSLITYLVLGKEYTMDKTITLTVSVSALLLLITQYLLCFNDIIEYKWLSSISLIVSIVIFIYLSVTEINERIKNIEIEREKEKERKLKRQLDNEITISKLVDEHYINKMNYPLDENGDVDYDCIGDKYMYAFALHEEFKSDSLRVIEGELNNIKSRADVNIIDKMRKIKLLSATKELLYKI